MLALVDVCLFGVRSSQYFRHMKTCRSRQEQYNTHEVDGSEYESPTSTPSMSSNSISSSYSLLLLLSALKLSVRGMAGHGSTERFVVLIFG